ncbi:HD domain-containing protein [bacterium]|nr:HD domain-containing protein [bacterium]
MSTLEVLLRERLGSWPSSWEGYHWPGYTYEHSLRVCDLALEIARRESADTDVVHLAALLHDIRKDSGRGHAETGAQEAAGILASLGVTGELRERVCNAIATHSGKNTPDGPVENRCLGDADLIDSNFGLVATWRFITIRSGHKASLPETVAAMREWLPKKDQLLALLLTRSGKEVARQRSARMRVFCEELMEEIARPNSADGLVTVAGFIHEDCGQHLLREQIAGLEELCEEHQAPSLLPTVCRSLRDEIRGLH